MNPLVLTRTFQSPVEKVFRTWSKKNELLKWWAIPGAIREVSIFQFRAGGVFHFASEAATDKRLWEKLSFSQVCHPHKLVFKHSFTDSIGSPVRAPSIPFGPLWPFETEHRVYFSKMDDSTLLRIECNPVRPSYGEEENFYFHADKVITRYSTSLNRLEELLSSASTDKVRPANE